MKDVDFKPETSIKEGIGIFIEWYREYYGKWLNEVSKNLWSFSDIFSKFND
jgi:hypothetical protein